MLHLKRAIGVLGNPRLELPIRLGWMAMVILLIYAIQHAPISSAWQTAISEGIAIFGGVELILDKIGDIRRARKMDELQQENDKKQQESDKKQQENDELRQENAKNRQEVDQLRQENDKNRQENDELRRRIDELEEIVKNRPPQDDPEA